jgi:uncharacterized membrane protein
MAIGTTEIIIILFVLAIIFVILIGIFLFIKLVFGKKDKADNDSKKCQYCVELIKSDAIVCRFCGRNLYAG